MRKISLELSHMLSLYRELKFLSWGRWFSYLLLQMTTAEQYFPLRVMLHKVVCNLRVCG